MGHSAKSSVFLLFIAFASRRVPKSYVCQINQGTAILNSSILVFQINQNVFLTPHLSPADSSPVLTMKRKLWNISMENQSFHAQWLLGTSRNTVFQSNSDHVLQENALGLTTTPPVGCKWHYNITRYHNVPIRLSVLTLTFANGHINLFELSCRLLDIYLGMVESGEVSRSLRYCNAKPTLDGTGASSWHSIPLQK